MGGSILLASTAEQDKDDDYAQVFFHKKFLVLVNINKNWIYPTRKGF